MYSKEGLTAVCNNCNKITDVYFEQDYHPNKIQETYFECGHCYYRYTSFVTDAWVRKKQRQAVLLRSKNKPVEELQEQINNRMSVLKYNLVNFGRADL